MKPFTKEHIDALDELIMARVGYILHHREGGWSNENLNADFDRLEKARNNLHALRVNDSEPEKVEGLFGSMGIHPGEQVVQDFLGSKYFNSEGEQAGIHLTNALGLELNGKYHPVYNPETHMLVPRVWSEEEWSKITVEIFNHSSARTWPSKPIEDIHYAITKVFGGEK